MKLLLLMILLLPSLAAGQMMSDAGPGFDPLAVPVTVDEAVALAADAKLGEAGIAAARSLVEGCDARLRRDAKRMDRALERAYLLHGRDEREAVDKVFEEERTKRQTSHDEASKEVLEDLKTLLPEGASEAWATFERRRHRRLFLYQSFRLGVRVDLIEVARVAKIIDDPAIRQVLTPYEVDLDRLLLARNPISVDWDRAQSDQDGAQAERFYTALRDADCAILRLQRVTARRLLELATAEKRSQVQGLILRNRLLGVARESAVRTRAGLLLKSGRLDEPRRKTLLGAARSYDERSHALDDGYCTAAEDVECTRTYAEGLTRRDNSSGLKWFEESRKLDVELLKAIDSVATEEDLDAIEENPAREP
jgi:hypothetical protein